MNKTQHWTLSFVGGICAVLIIGNLVLMQFNERSNESLVATQSELNRAQQMQTTLQNFAVRIAQAGRTDAALSNLLVRHDLKVSLNSETPAKPAP